jgi:NitT/TauT family transport system ATP-binding protein
MSDLTVNVGFIPLLDCAPLVIAAENGFAAAEGVDLRLVRETSWANIRDRVAVGHFEAAHMLGPMVVAATLGAGHLQVPMIAPVALNVGGNAITVSVPLWTQMAEEGASLGADPLTQARALAAVLARRVRAGLPPLTFAMVFPFSCHNYELRYWLDMGGIDPDFDLRLVVLPPPLLGDALRSGQVDGFCVGEPWNSLAAVSGFGCVVTTTSEIWEHSPEKVLGMRLDWAEAHPRETAALVRTVVAAARWCDSPDNHAELAALLSEPRYVGVPATVLRSALDGRLPFSQGAEPLVRPDFIRFERYWATVPWPEHAAWFYEQMRRWGQVEAAAGLFELARSSYRPDLYRAALAGMPAARLPPAERPGGLGRFFTRGGARG